MISVNHEPEVSIRPHDLDLVPFEVVQSEAAWTRDLRFAGTEVDVNLLKKIHSWLIAITYNACL